MSYIIEKTNFGWIGVSCSAKGITGVVLPQKTKRGVISRLPGPGESKSVDRTNYLSGCVSRIRMYFEGKNVEFPDKLDYSRATGLQRKVWEETRRIPYGHTGTYGQIARKVSCRSPRAVGQALKKNPFPVIVPCHRVIGSSGRLVGFAGGLKLKEHMLKIEKTI